MACAESLDVNADFRHMEAELEHCTLKSCVRTRDTEKYEAQRER